MKGQTKKSAVIFLFLFPLIMTIPLYLLGKMKLKYFAGEFAYCLFIFDTILGLRPEWIERKVELRKLYMVHGILAILAVGFTAIHVSLSHLHGIAGLCGNIAFYGSIALTGLALVFLSNQILAVIPGMESLLKGIQKVAAKFKIDRELNLIFRSLTPLIVIFTFLHVCLIPKFNRLAGFMTVFVGYFVIFSAWYLYYGIYRKLTVSTYWVKKVQMMNSQTYELTLTKANGKPVVVQSGQFVFIHAPFAKLNEYHPFSVVAVSENQQTITLGIKIVGDFTAKLAQVKVGTAIKIKGGYGHFENSKTNIPVVAIAGGIGITACLGLLNQLAPDQKAELIWSIRSDEDLVFKDQLNDLVQKNPNLKVMVHQTAQKGHLNQQVLEEMIPELKNGMPANYYLCGPKPMMKSIRQILLTDGVQRQHLLEEGFIF